MVQTDNGASANMRQNCTRPIPQDGTPSHTSVMEVRSRRREGEALDAP